MAYYSYPFIPIRNSPGMLKKEDERKHSEVLLNGGKKFVIQ